MVKQDQYKERTAVLRAAWARLRHGGRRRIGVFGGSFDPVHQAHWLCAESLRKSLRLHQVFWLVARNNPFKYSSSVDYQVREQTLIKFLKQRNAKKHIVTTLHHDCVSCYTIEFLRLLSRRCHHHLYWLAGSDLINKWHRWYNWQNIPQLSKICIYNRPRSTHQAVMHPMRRKIYFYGHGHKSSLSSKELREISLD